MLDKIKELYNTETIIEIDPAELENYRDSFGIYKIPFLDLSICKDYHPLFSATVRV